MSINLKNLVAGTRPELGKKIIVTASPDFDGYEIVEYKGMVWGLSIRSKDAIQDCIMSFKQFTGGELESYTQLGDEARQKALDRMLSMASRLGANGIIDFRFQIDSKQYASGVSAYGTAVVLKPVVNYVPTGAVGNILAAMAISSKSPQENVPAPKAADENTAESSDKTPPEPPQSSFARLKHIEGKAIAVCPACNSRYNVTSVLNDPLYDYELSEPGLQIKCRKCGTIFTLPGTEP